MELKLVIDPKLKARMESIRIAPNRSFYCGTCRVVRDRNGVNKDIATGIYTCLYCGKQIEKIVGAG